MSTLAMRPERMPMRPEDMPADAGTAPEYRTPELVNRVRNARLLAFEARQEAGKIIAAVCRTTVRVVATRQQTAGKWEQRHRIAGGRSGHGEAGYRAPGPFAPDPLPVNAPPDRVTGKGLDHAPDTLRRAVAFIEDHAAQDIDVTDIAAACFVSVRAVQVAFRRHLGTTPTKYLRQVRLDHAHRDLIAADPSHGTVTAVAYRWGFPSPSRFSAYYRRAYGAPPSHTLSGQPPNHQPALPGTGQVTLTRDTMSEALAPG